MARKRPNRRGRAADRGPNLTVYVVVAVVVLGVVAVVLSRGGGDDDDGGAAGGETRAVTVSGADTLPPFTDPSTDPARGAEVPTLTGERFDGGAITIPGSRPAVVMFLAHWCSHCQAEVPRVAAWLAANGPPDGVDLFAVSTSVNRAQGNFPPSAWLEREGWEIATLVDSDDNAAATAWAIGGFPFFVAVNGDGEVVARISGEIETSTLEALIEAARTG